MNYYAALDVGTTGCRTILFDNKGREVSRHYEEWESFFPTPIMVEQDAKMWWNALLKTIHLSVSKGKVDFEKIKSVAVTNQRETIVPVDKEGNPLHNAIVWQDRRTTEECDYIKNTIGEESIYKTTGLIIDPYFSLSKILWIKNNKPEIYKQAYKFMLVHDFITQKLTGKWVTDYSNASRTMLFDINDLKWSDDIASKLEIDLDKMPEPVPSGSEIGYVTSDESKFSKKTMVVAGGGDQQCAALGVGVNITGRTKCTTGTGSFILGYLKEPKFDPNRRVLCSCHAIPGAWVQEASIFTTGSVLRWMRDNVCSDEVREAKEQNKDPYDLMNTLAEQSPVGSNGLIIIPHMMGAGAPHWNPDARGVIFGMTLGHNKGDLIRALMEGVAFEVKKNIELFEELGNEIKEMRITGGGSRSNIWNQIMADVLNVTLSRGDLEESTAVGAMILAAYGVGDYKSIVDASNKLSRMTKSWTPNPKNLLSYNQIYAVSKDLYESIEIQNLYKRLEL